MSNLMIHSADGKHVDLDQLRLIPVPDQTKSYTAVPHVDFANAVKTISLDLLRGYELHNEQYGIAREGSQLFGMLSFRAINGQGDTGISVGMRNSYDKSISLGMACGASVFVCDNLAFRGDITILRRHTTNVWDRLKESIVHTLYEANKNYSLLQADMDIMRGIKLSNNDAFRALGMLYGHDIISIRQLPVAMENWLNSPHKEFADRNQWSFYNAITESLKSCQPPNILEKHIKLHEAIMEPEKLDERIEVEAEVITEGNIYVIDPQPEVITEAIEAMTAIDPGIIEHIEPEVKKRVKKAVPA